MTSCADGAARFLTEGSDDTGAGFAIAVGVDSLGHFLVGCGIIK